MLSKTLLIPSIWCDYYKAWPQLMYEWSSYVRHHLPVTFVNMLKEQKWCVVILSVALSLLYQ